jgi:hypothetical protein
MNKLGKAFGLGILMVVSVALAQQGANSTNLPLPANVATLGQQAQIDWSKNLLIAEGIGIAAGNLSEAQKEVRSIAAARADAQRILVSAVRGVKVSSSSTVQNFELISDEIKLSVQGMLQFAVPLAGSEKLDRKKDGSFLARISYALPLYGDNSILETLMPTINDQAQANPPRVAQVTAAPSPAPQPAGVPPTTQPTTQPANPPATQPANPPATQPANPPATQPANPPANPPATQPANPPATQPANPPATQPANPPAPEQLPTYTGLIVDARGLNFSPCMNPKILISNGAEVWGTIYTTSELANDIGIASFVRNLEEATRLRDRGAPGQLTLKAIQARGPIGSKCDAVLSDPDAALLKRADTRFGFLKDFKVTFVY